MKECGRQYVCTRSILLSMRRYTIFFGIAVLLSACTPTEPERPQTPPTPTSAVPRSSVAALRSSAAAAATVSSKAAPVAVDIPSTFDIAVPFTSQAPHANWDDPYQEACEEAALIMVHRFLQGESGVLDVNDADQEILKLVQWETENGFDQDVTIAELKDIAERYYGYRGTIEENVTPERIKELIAAGKPIIIPAAGRELGNPYFSGEGPFYHMLVIRGYDRNEFITNDPGTRRGESYEYGYDQLIDAIHDWTGVKEETYLGAKRMLVLEKK